MMFCHKLYIIECINLIINKEAHLLLTVGNKIVTKKTKKFAWWWASCAKVTKDSQQQKQNWRKEKDCFSFRQYVSFAANRYKFSPFWIYKQKNRLNLYIHTRAHTILFFQGFA